MAKKRTPEVMPSRSLVIKPVERDVDHNIIKPEQCRDGSVQQPCHVDGSVQRSGHVDGSVGQ